MNHNKLTINRKKSKIKYMNDAQKRKVGDLINRWSSQKGEEEKMSKTIFVTYRMRIFPTPKQEDILERSFAAARVVYNHLAYGYLEEFKHPNPVFSEKNERAGREISDALKPYRLELLKKISSGAPQQEVDAAVNALVDVTDRVYKPMVDADKQKKKQYMIWKKRKLTQYGKIPEGAVRSADTAIFIIRDMECQWLACSEVDTRIRPFFRYRGKYADYQDICLKTNASTRFRTDGYVFFPVIGWMKYDNGNGRIKFRENIQDKAGEKAILEPVGKMKNIRIRKMGSGRFYMIVTMEVPYTGEKLPTSFRAYYYKVKENCVGIDFGTDDFIVCSDGKRYPFCTEELQHDMARLAKAKSKLAVKQPYSESWKAQRKRVCKIQEWIDHKRHLYLNEVAEDICKDRMGVFVSDFQYEKWQQRNDISGEERRLIREWYLDFFDILESHMDWKLGQFIKVPYAADTIDRIPKHADEKRALNNISQGLKQVRAAKALF